MPEGLVRSGDYRNGTPLTAGHQFGNSVFLPEPFGNPIPQSNPTLDSNPVTWVPSPAHFGNTVGYSLQAVPSVVIVEQAGAESTNINLTVLTGGPASMTLTSSGAPTGVLVAFVPNPDTGTSVATVTVNSAVLLGRYTITVTGTAGSGEVETTNIQLIVTASGGPSAEDFLLQEDGVSFFTLEDGSGFILLEV